MDNTITVGNDELIHDLLDVILKEVTLLMSPSAVTGEVIEQSGPENEMILSCV